MVSYATGGTAAFRVSRRSTLSAMLGSSSQRFLDDEYSIRSVSYGGGYSHSVSRYASLRLGYAQQDTDYSFEAAPKRRYTQRNYDVGVNYSRPLSLSRRTTFSFGTGSAVLDDGTETFFNVTGSASLSHQIGRTWEANVVYARGLGTVAGFVEPTFADSVNANLRGTPEQQVNAQRDRRILEWKCRRCGRCRTTTIPFRRPLASNGPFSATGLRSTAAITTTGTNTTQTRRPWCRWRTRSVVTALVPG